MRPPGSSFGCGSRAGLWKRLGFAAGHGAAFLRQDSPAPGADSRTSRGFGHAGRSERTEPRDCSAAWAGAAPGWELECLFDVFFLCSIYVYTGPNVPPHPPLFEATFQCAVKSRARSCLLSLACWAWVLASPGREADLKGGEAVLAGGGGCKAWVSVPPLARCGNCTSDWSHWLGGQGGSVKPVLENLPQVTPFGRGCGGMFQQQLVMAVLDSVQLLARVCPVRFKVHWFVSGSFPLVGCGRGSWSLNSYNGNRVPWRDKKKTEQSGSFGPDVRNGARKKELG